jgi:hypothetical protein
MKCIIEVIIFVCVFKHAVLQEHKLSTAYGICDHILTFGKKLRDMLSCICPEHCINYFCSCLCHKNDALQSLSL